MSRTRTATATRRAPAPPVPRRVSGPIRPGHPRPVTAVPPRVVAPVPARGGRPGVTTGVSEKLKALPDHRWLDALLRSRAWIWMLGIALGGIVAMQVSLLSMNAGIGRDVQTSSDLQHANAKLAEQVAELSGGERIGLLAGRMGLMAPAAGDVGYLGVRPGLDATRAAQNMVAPSAAARARMEGTATPDPAATTAPVTATDPAAVATPAPTAAAPAETATPAPTATPVPTPVATAAPVTETSPVTAPVNSTAGAVAAPTG